MAMLHVIALASAIMTLQAIHAAAAMPMMMSAIYFQTNDLMQNCIVAIAIDPMTGMLTDMNSTTPTEGKGGAATVMNNGTSVPATTDGLFSQSSVTSGANLVFAVNAGSNTLSMFKVDPMMPTKLTLVGKPAATLGQFPISVAFSPAIMVACVLNGGAKAGVTCFSVDAAKGLMPLDKSARRLNLAQTTPPHGPTDGSASQILFNPQSTAVIAVLKGNAANGHRGNLAIYPVDCYGAVSRTASVAPFTSTNFLFGSAFASDTLLVVSDPANSALTIKVDVAKGTAAVAMYRGRPAISNITGQKAICWATYSKATKTAFLADAGRGMLSEIDPFKGGRTVGTIDATPMNITGFFDMAVGGRYLYALAPRQRAVAVVDVVKSIVVQVLKGSFPVSITGLAIC